MNEYVIKEINPNSYFTKTVYLDDSFVLSSPEMVFSGELVKILEKWNYTKVYSEGEPNSEYSLAKGPNETTAIVSNQSDAVKIDKAEKFYTAFQKFIDDVFLRLTVSDELNFKVINDKIMEVIDFIKEDRKFLMRVLKNLEPPPDKNYIASHSVRSAILAIIIGTYLKLPNYRLLELGVAALLHEVGMLKLPQQIYLSKRALSPQEQKAILSHPILGYTSLKSMDFPLAVCLAALEHHERENGSGYPRRLSGEKISQYSKIIAVACSYDALSSKRPHKEAKDGYTGMLELLKNEGKRYDDTIVRALVLSLSIYPIGLYVLLSNGKKGQVVDINSENPRFPIVQVFGELTPDGRTKTVQTAPNVLSIVRPLSHSEMKI
jgi:HD-GYP domain-containing protein (c-di-GMP phosphodiesterase class II)